MLNNKIIKPKNPAEFTEDSLTELFRNRERQLIANLVEAELHKCP